MNAQLNMTLAERESGVRRPVAVFHHRHVAPTPPQFFIEIPSDSGTYTLTFHGVPRAIHLDLCLQQASASTAEGPATIAAVLIPWTRDDALEAQSLLLNTFLSHHVPSSLSRVLLFVRSSQKAAYNRHPAWLDPVGRHLVDGTLSLVEWDALAEPSIELGRTDRAGTDQYFDQVIVYNFALLSFWETSTKLLLIDLDEFLVLHERDSLATLLALSAKSGCVHLTRRAILPGPGPAKLSASFDNAAWERVRGTYGLLGIGNAVQQLHTVACETHKLGKLLVDPNLTFGVHVHYGLTCKDGVASSSCAVLGACEAALEGCAHILHNRNMVQVRDLNEPTSPCSSPSTSDEDAPDV